MHWFPTMVAVLSFLASSPAAVLDRGVNHFQKSVRKIFGIFWDFLGFLGFFGIYRNFWDFLGFFWDFLEKCTRFFRVIYPSSWITLGLQFFGIFWDFLGFFEIFWDFLRFFRIFWDFLGFFWDLMRFLRLEVFGIFWKSSRDFFEWFTPRLGSHLQLVNMGFYLIFQLYGPLGPQNQFLPSWQSWGKFFRGVWRG